MEKVFTKSDLEKLEDRFEYEFGLPFRTNEMPDKLIEIHSVPYAKILSGLLNGSFSLILCVPRLPVEKSLKRADVLDENDSFKLLRISAKHYTSHIEEFLREIEHYITFFWIQHSRNVKFKMPKTSQEQLILSNLCANQLYALSLENEEYTVIGWD
ncbi:hypothetical protein [Planomicrobium sp. CPCC 101079]|uniref:hypothetical protein n=1 Tax=Planomicrobium sp. CPCC 101079 TaxID=2599618 RepID=UPI0011B5D7FB|nr:hypothetical protein [Planomicrobium sp. CPCC 101079]TWT09248.1 hypothetical protein FQV28_06335 [Planomicrobium sp. CPCC 101079]